MATAQQIKAQIKAKQEPLTETFIDPTQDTPIPIIVQKVIPKFDRPQSAAFALESFQANFTVMVRNKRYMFTNYRFETDDKDLVDQMISEYAPRVWRVIDG